MTTPLRIFQQLINTPGPAIRLITTLLGLCVYGSAALAGNDITALLKKMAEAEDTLNYEGVFILRRDDELMPMRVEHGVDDRGIWESIEALNGETRRIVRNNDEVMSIYPDRKLITVSHAHSKSSLHPSLPSNLDGLSQYYHINQLDNERIAGHDSVVIDVQPNDNFRYGYRYWIDESTGVMLRCDLLNEAGTVIEQMMFVTMAYTADVPQGAFAEIPQEGYTLRKLDSQRKPVDEIEWNVAEPPNGFMLTQSTRREDDHNESLHLVFSDGLASVSVFIEPDASSYHHLDGASSMGALNAYGTKVDGYFVTVMGEVPTPTVLQFANSTHHIHKTAMSDND